MINMGVLELNTVATTVGTSHTTVSTPGGTNNVRDMHEIVLLLVCNRFWFTSGFVSASHSVVLHQKSDQGR